MGDIADAVTHIRFTMSVGMDFLALNTSKISHFH